MGDLHELLPLLMKGTLVTVEIAAFAILLAILMAGVATVLRTSAWRVLRWAGNVYVEVFRGTSLVSLITLSDLTFRARQLDEATFKTAEIFALTLAIYFVLAQIVVTVMRHFERRVSHGITQRIVK